MRMRWDDCCSCEPVALPSFSLCRVGQWSFLALLWILTLCFCNNCGLWSFRSVVESNSWYTRLIFLQLSVWRTGTVCRMTLLTVCHWHHSAGNWKLFCFLYHFRDYIFLLSSPWGFYSGHFKNFVFMCVSYVCMYDFVCLMHDGKQGKVVIV